MQDRVRNNSLVRAKYRVLTAVMVCAPFFAGLSVEARSVDALSSTHAQRPSARTSMERSDLFLLSGKPKQLWSVSVGFPDTLALRLQRRVAPRHFFGTSFGYVPVGMAIPQLREPQVRQLNEKFDMTLSTQAHLFSLGLFYNYYVRPWFFIEGSSSIVTINAEGQAYLTNHSTSGSTGLAEIELTVYQPVLAVAAGFSAYRSPTWKLDIGAGISYLFPYAIQTQVRGALPSFLDVAPEYRESIIDGREELERDLLDALKSLPLDFPIFPTFFVRGTW